jgi:cytochrome c-type biogenesis protein CcmH/NrfF
MKMRTRWMRVAVAATALRAAAPVSAQDRTPASEAVALEAISQIRSPYCPGLMLEVCPSQQADFLRDSIRTTAAQGVPAQAIVERVVAAHGERYRGLPKRSGVALWAWVMPPFVLLLGLAIVAVRIVQLRRRRAGEVEPDATLSPDDRARLDAELRAFERTEAAP